MFEIADGRILWPQEREVNGRKGCREEGEGNKRIDQHTALLAFFGLLDDADGGALLGIELVG
ncbi:MAG: hypothetical protein WCH98_10930, partial [Verrucomicrobiota bacterium]